MPLMPHIRGFDLWSLAFGSALYLVLSALNPLLLTLFSLPFHC